MKVILLSTIIKFFNIVNILIFVRIILSWIRVGYGSAPYQFIHGITEPILYPCRLLLEKIGLRATMFDFSPLVAVLLLNLLQRVLITLVYSI